MRFAVSFIDSHGCCAVTGKSDPMEFMVPVPDGMDSFDGALFALNEVARVRGMSPRALPALSQMRATLVDVEQHPASQPTRPLLAAVPDPKESP